MSTTTTNRDGSVHAVSTELAEGAAIARVACDAAIARLGGLGSMVTGPMGYDGDKHVATGTMTRVVNEFFVSVLVDGREYVANPARLAKVSA